MATTTLLSINKEDKTYNDENVVDTHLLRVMYFDGQRKASRNSWITVGSILIEKVDGLWYYVGIVVHVRKVEPANNIDCFLLVVEKNTNTGRTSRTKKLLMEQISWVLTDEAPGIAHVTHV